MKIISTLIIFILSTLKCRCYTNILNVSYYLNFIILRLKIIKKFNYLNLNILEF